MSDPSTLEPSATAAKPLTAAKVLALIGMTVGMTVFLGGMFIGMSIHPQEDMHGRLVAYTAALGGFALGIACRVALSTTRVERIVFGAMTIATALGAVAYGLVML